MPGNGASEIMDNTIIEGYDSLYRAYAKASWRAARDPDWEPIRDRLYDVMKALEKAALVLSSAGYAPGLRREHLRRLEAAVASGDAPTAVEQVSILEERARIVKALNAVVPRHLCAYRIVVLVLVGLTAAVLPVADIVGAILGVASIGLALASVLACFTPLATPSQVISLVLLYAAILYTALYQGRIPGAEALLGAAAAWAGAVAGYIDLRKGARLYLEALSGFSSEGDNPTHTNA